ncbi:MAG: prepilin-type N-terminal cleavage/methylation domain-containing protein [Eubacterium sp.]|nr:prepilin-type N-terminal cleavage/methylation domain-containing protein [Eubacterium sp.]
MKKSNKGFSLVELIIAIAIMAIISVAIGLAIIRYINKARKADDLAAADTIGATISAAIADDEDLYHFVEIAVSSTGNNLTKANIQNGWLRVLGYCNSPRNRYDMKFHAINTAGVTAAEKKSFEDGMNAYLGTNIPRLQFYLFDYLDEWIICADGDGKLYVFIGSGMNDDRYHMKPKYTGGRACINNANRYCYQVWPEVDPAYTKLSKPGDAR